MLGKTQLLCHIISLQLLPSVHLDIGLQGKGSAVLLLDLDSRFSVLRLRDIMQGHVRSCFNHCESLNLDIRSLVYDSFQHLHIFRPQSSASLLATLASLEGYLFSITSHFSANRPVGAIVLYNLNAFLWQDRLDEAEDPARDPSSPHQGSGVLSQRWKHIVASLRGLQCTFSCPIMTTSSALSSLVPTSSTGYPSPSLRPHLPGVWRSFVSTKLIVKRDSVRKFALGVSVEEAARKAEQRREAVEKSGFSACVDWAGSENWREEFRKAVRKLPGCGEVCFRVTADRVVFRQEDGAS